ncbi:hypothetical protein [Tepidanaerobacter acetatoxydans]|uniref:hypothetical protein n=1 Tax=Tepidanaerobacter acetatoxydans TaxID=499229 RepID=UPI00020C008C|nr:hypothetical protein [Tepidanaerobacter acetatoxydans]AEE91181.1 hypothetical protein TepRe1_1033 [Tepidanaerobacter acetatoxydans Re1]
MNWITENRNRNKIAAINFIVRKIVKTTNYSDKTEVSCNSKRVRNLFRQREKLYREGSRCKD